MADETPLSIAHPEMPPYGGVVVLQEVFGVTPHIEDVCQRFADAGWLAVAPHLFHRTGDPILPYDDYAQVKPHVQALDPAGILADIDAGLEFLAGAGFPADSCGVVGFCAGGSMAMYAAVERTIGAAVTYYGGGVIEGRFGFPPLVELGPRLQAPWLGLFGEQDRGIPVEQVEQLAEAAATAEVRTEVEIYAGAGHAFNRDGAPTYVEAAARDAWMRTLDWFADNLTTGATESG